MDKEFHLWINSKMTILKKILKYIGVKKSKVERKNQDIDSNDSLSDMESIVLAMADDAKSLMDRWDFANFTFTKSGGFVDAQPELYWETCVRVLDLASRFDADEENHYYLGRSLLNLADYKVGEEKIAVLHNSIDHLEIAKSIKSINLDFLNCYFLTLAYDVLGDELEGSEMIQAKRKAEEYSKQTIQFEEGKNDGDAYCDLGNIVCDLADEDEVFHRKMERRHEGIGYLQKSVRLDATCAYNQSSLGIELTSLAEDTVDLEKKMRCYGYALKHLQKAYAIDNDSSTLQTIQEIKESMI